jgi:hypothetical protein
MHGTALKVTLPGEMYERTGRWWWRVQLPGEDRAKARPLKPDGARAAASDRDTAERLAVEMWEDAVRRQGARQITLQCTEKVERLKAQFLDKVRQLTEIVESANAKAEAEARARAEAEAQLQTMIQPAAERPPDIGPSQAGPATNEGTPAPMLQQGHDGEDTPSGDSQPAIPTPTAPAACVAPSNPLPDAAKAPCTPHPLPPPVAQPDGVRGTQAQATASSTSADGPSSVTPQAPARPTPVQTGTCECCGDIDIPTADLEHIDSGQLLCKDCLRAFRTDIARIEEAASIDY